MSGQFCVLFSCEERGRCLWPEKCAKREPVPSPPAAPELPEKTWEQFADEFHATVLQIIEGLIAQDPPTDSPEGRLLKLLAVATENYEKARWPLLVVCNDCSKPPIAGSDYCEDHQG